MRVNNPGGIGDRNGQWGGGRRQTGFGYVYVYAPDHPHANKAKVVLEHRLVMEEVLGRFLAPLEVVHHRNGIVNDNRPENLELWTRSQPPGKRVTDLVEWATELLAQYAPDRLCQ